MLYYFQPSFNLVEYWKSPQIKIAPRSLKAGRPSKLQMKFTLLPHGGATLADKQEFQPSFVKTGDLKLQISNYVEPSGIHFSIETQLPGILAIRLSKIKLRYRC